MGFYSLVHRTHTCASEFRVQLGQGGKGSKERGCLIQLNTIRWSVPSFVVGPLCISSSLILVLVAVDGTVDGFLTLLFSKNVCFREAKGKVVRERKDGRKKKSREILGFGRGWI